MPVSGITFNNMRNIMSMPQNTRGPQPGLPLTVPGGSGNLLGQVLFGAATFVHSAGPQASALQNSLASINGIMGASSAVPSNREVLQVSSFNGSVIPDVSVVVDYVATAQQNQGATMQASARDVAPGIFNFEITAGGASRVVSFTTTEPLTNREFQERMAAAINEADLGVTSRVTVSGGYSALNISSNLTGVPEGGVPHFTIRDINGGAVEKMGVGEITHEPQNAVFRINGGEPVEQTSNEVDLGGGLVVTLLKPSENAVTFEEGFNEVGIRALLRTIVGQVNALLDTARTNVGDVRTRNLVREIEGVIRRSRRDLQSVGITMSQNGRLEINEQQFRTASENGTAAAVFGGDRRPGPIVSALSRIAENVARNPMRHISPHVLRLPGFNNALQIVAGGGANTRDANTFAAYFLQESFGSLFDTIS